jgi:hypothetical protein
MKYLLSNGHIIIQHKGNNLLVDTGSPTSFGNINSVVFEGSTFELPDSMMGMVNVGSLTDFIGTAIDALIGNDILSQFDVEIAPSTNEVNFFVPGTSELQGAIFPFADSLSFPIAGIADIPVIIMPINGRETKIIFDTGAKLSYLGTDYTQDLISQETMRDFNPLIGDFETPVFVVPITIGDTTIHLKMGNLPPMAEMAVGMLAEGILGSALLEKFTITVAFSRRKIAFRAY